jgi:hypothetical protein
MIENAITKVVRIAGGQDRLAKQLRPSGAKEKPLTRQSVSLWVRQGYVPVNRAIEISGLVDGRVPPCDLIDPTLRAILETMLPANQAA